MQEFRIQTQQRNELVDITSQVRNYLREQDVKSGSCLVYCPHTTAGITINENADPTVPGDMLRKLAELVPANDGYRHLEGNSDAHIKSSLIGASAQIMIADGHLCLGTWQGIFFCEFDGPRQRRFWVQLQPAVNP